MSVYSKQEIDELIDSIKKQSNGVATALLQKVTNSSKLEIDNLASKLLHSAVKYENVTILRRLIELGCNINVQDDHGLTPLMQAVRNKNLEIVQILIENNADIYITSNAGINALTFAVFNELSNGFSPIRNPHMIFEIILNTINTDFSMNNRRAITQIFKYDIFEKLAIVGSGSIELTKFMLENGYEINDCEPTRSLTAILWAVVSGKLENVKMLMERGASFKAPDRQKFSPLHFYLMNMERVDEERHVLKALIDSNWVIRNQEDRNYVRSEVMHFLSNGNKETIRAVLQSKINVLSMNLFSGRSLLNILAGNKHDDVLDLLDEFNIAFDVNEVCDTGTALFVAVRIDCLKKVEFLLKHGADANWISPTGESALFVACENSCENTTNKDSNGKIVELLLAYGANAQFYPNFTHVLDIFTESRINDHDLSANPSLKAVLNHLALIEATLTDTTREKILDDTRLQNIFDLCIVHNKMKAIEVYKKVSLFEILTESHEKTAAYFRNQCFTLAFKKRIEENGNLGSYYVNSLLKNMLKAVDRIELENNAAKALEVLSGICSDTYQLIFIRIVRYLHDTSLNNLCQATDLEFSRPIKI